uniref:(northern house mosquito) hypothetical protein n=1 Tax=Culex pipiens TaxID=7175 RepID=A0A8D8KP95_CULPI
MAQRLKTNMTLKTKIIKLLVKFKSLIASFGLRRCLWLGLMVTIFSFLIYNLLHFLFDVSFLPNIFLIDLAAYERHLLTRIMIASDCKSKILQILMMIVRRLDLCFSF